MTRRRKAAEIARDKRRIAELYLHGWLQVDIAEEVGVNQSTISRDLKSLHKEWLQSALVDIDEAKAKELAEVDNLEREYWRAWERSQLDKEIEIQETVTGGKEGSREREQTRLEGQAGDPRFLNGVEWCVERRCKLLGLDAPTRTDVTSGGERLPGVTVYLPEIDELEAESGPTGEIPS